MPTRPQPDRHDRHLTNLRRWRNRGVPDLSLGFITRQFRNEIERPFKQLGNLAVLWQRHVPDALLERTALRGLQRGTLSVVVTDSASLYQLDRLLRQGLERTIRQGFKGTLRRVRLELGSVEGDGPKKKGNQK